MPSAIQAAPIFPSCNGQEMMTEIFGRDAGFFSIWNGIMMSYEAEVHFARGHFVIVPDVEHSDSAVAEMSRWNHHDEPRNHKIRIVNPQGRDMDTLVNGEGSVRWCELDGKRVSFRGKARPQARYLYYHYCVTMLRRSWNGDEKAGFLNDELGKPFWAATPGPYLRKRMLTALVEEMGHEYDALLAGAMEDDDDTLLRAATQHIQNSNGGEDEMSKAVKDGDEGDSETDEEGSSDE